MFFLGGLPRLGDGGLGPGKLKQRTFLGSRTDMGSMAALVYSGVCRPKATQCYTRSALSSLTEPEPESSGAGYEKSQLLGRGACAVRDPEVHGFGFRLSELALEGRRGGGCPSEDVG